MKIHLRQNEQVIKAADARYFNNSEVDGKLILTNQGLYFKCDDLLHNLDLPFAAISEAIPYKTKWFSNNGLAIIKSTGRAYKFSLKKRNGFCELLNSKI